MRSHFARLKWSYIYIPSSVIFIIIKLFQRRNMLQNKIWLVEKESMMENNVIWCWVVFAYVCVHENWANISDTKIKSFPFSFIAPIIITSLSLAERMCQSQSLHHIMQTRRLHVLSHQRIYFWNALHSSCKKNNDSIHLVPFYCTSFSVTRHTKELQSWFCTAV